MVGLRLRQVWIALVLVMLAGFSTPPAPAGTLQLRLESPEFDWTTVDDQDRAHFHWTASVVNTVARAFDVEITVDLLDDDDAVVHSDSTKTHLGAHATQAVEHAGSLEYDRASDVVSFRFRLVPSPPEGN